MHNMINKEMKYSLFDKSIRATLPSLEIKTDETAYGTITTPYAFTGLQGYLYHVVEATTGIVGYVIAGSDIRSAQNLSYTVYNKTIDWHFDPEYVANDGFTGVVSGELYGISFRTDKTYNASSIKHSPDILIKITDQIGDYGVTGSSVTNIYIGPQGETGLQGITGALETDWTSNSGKITGNLNGTTGMVTNILFGTGDAPTGMITGMITGTLYFKYTE